MPAHILQVCSILFLPWLMFARHGAEPGNPRPGAEALKALPHISHALVRDIDAALLQALEQNLAVAACLPVRLKVPPHFSQERTMGILFLLIAARVVVLRCYRRPSVVLAPQSLPSHGRPVKLE